MILADEFIRLNVSASFKEMFLVVIQIGSILAVIVLYFNRLNPFSGQKTTDERRRTWIMWFKTAVACLPAAVLGLLFDDKIEALFYNYRTVTNMLLIYGALFIIVENVNKKRASKINSIDDMTYRTAFLIGLFQVLALIPGTSRSGATIIGAMILGTARATAAEFSFFLAIPVMFGAGALKLVKFGLNYTGSELAVLLVGMLTAFIVSVSAIKFLINFIRKNSFKAFGYYRIILGISVFMYFTFKTK